MDEATGIYDIYYLKEDAVKLLLAGLGQTQWYGLFDGAQADSGIRTQANRILAELYQSGVIDWDGDGAAVKAPYAQIFSAMLERKSCVTIQSAVLQSPVRCCYLSAADVVITQKSQREERMLGIALLSAQGFVSLLKEECKRLETGESCLLSCRSSQTGQAFSQLLISRSGLRAYQVQVKTADGVKTCLRWMQEEFAARLAQLLYGQKRKTTMIQEGSSL